MTPEVREQIRKEYFHDHIAEMLTVDTGPSNLYKIEWRNRGGSSTGYMLMVFYNGVLFVSGDLGSAVFRWHYTVRNIGELRGFDVGYMHGKCEASPVGRDFSTYKADAALMEIKSALEGEDIELTEDQKDSLQSVERMLKNVSDGRETEDALTLCGDDLNNLFGGDLADLRLGKTMDLQMQLIWVGVQEALDSLFERGMGVLSQATVTAHKGYGKR